MEVLSRMTDAMWTESLSGKWNGKTCPKCDGAVTKEHDQYGTYEFCIQCGYHQDLQDPHTLRFIEHNRW